MGKVGRLGPVLGPRGLDAEPEDRHRDHGRRPRPCPRSRAARSSSGSTSTRTCTSSSARRRSPTSSWWRTTAPRLDEILRAEAVRRPRAATSRRAAITTTIGPGVPLDVNAIQLHGIRTVERRRMRPNWRASPPSRFCWPARRTRRWDFHPALHRAESLRGSLREYLVDSSPRALMIARGMTRGVAGYAMAVHGDLIDPDVAALGDRAHARPAS